MKKFFCLWVILSFLMIATFCNAAFADTSASVDKSKRTVNVAFFPLSGIAKFENGKPVSGYGYEFLQLLKNNAPWEFKYQESIHPWNETLSMLSTGKLDMVAFLVKTPEREDEFKFSKLAMCVPSIILTAKADNSKYFIDDYRNWDGIRIGMLENSEIFSKIRHFAHEKDFRYQTVYFDTMDHMLADLQTGKRIDATVSIDTRSIENEWIYGQLGSTPFYIAVKKSDTELCDQLDSAMQELFRQNPEILDELHNQYCLASPESKIAYSKEELEFISKMKKSGTVLTAVLNPEREPISYCKNGKYGGALKLIADEIITRTGLDIRFKPLSTRDEYTKEVFTKQDVDLVFDFTYNLNKADSIGYQLTSPYYIAPLSLLHRKEISKNFKTLALLQASNQPYLLNEYFAYDAKTINFKTLDDCIKSIGNGTCDAMYIHTKIAEMITRSDLRGRFAAQIIPDKVLKYSVAIRENKDYMLFSIINKAVRSIDNDFINNANLISTSATDNFGLINLIVARNPVLFYGIGIFALSFLFAALWYVIHSRRIINNERRILTMAIESENDGVIITDSMGKIVQLNPSAMELLGICSKNAEKRLIFNVFKGIDNFSTIEAELRNVLFSRYRGSISNEVALVSQQGTKLSISYSINPITSNDGGLIGAILILRDVTDEKRRQQELQTEIKQWNLVSKITKVFKFSFKFESRELIGELPQEIWPSNEKILAKAENWIYPKDLNNWKINLDKLKSDESKEIVFGYRVQNNEGMRHFRICLRREPESKVFSGILQDLTRIVLEREKKEAVMRLWQICVESFPFLMFIKSIKDFRITQCNSYFSEYFNRKPEEIIGRTESELVKSSQTVANFLRSDIAAIKSKNPLYFHEIICDHNGDKRYFRTTKIAAKDANNEPILICMSVEETNEIVHQNELFHLTKIRDEAEEIAKTATYQLNYKTRTFFGSKKLSEYWPIRDGKALFPEEVVIPDDIQICKQQIKSVTSGDETSVNFEYRRQVNGRLHYYKVSARKATGFDNCITGLIMDVTQSKLDQNKQEALRNLWQAILKSIPAILFVKDADDGFKYLYANNNLGILLKHNVESLIGHRELEFMHPNDAIRIHKSDVEAMNTNKPTVCYELIRDSDGRDHHFRSVKIPSVNEFGHRIMIQMSTDISEVHELSEVRKIVANAFESLFFFNNLQVGVRELLRQVCQFVGFTSAYVHRIDNIEDKIGLFCSYIAENERPVFSEKAFSLEEASKFEWFKKIQNSGKGDILSLDLCNEADLDILKNLAPHILDQKDSLNIRSIYVIYLSVNETPWGQVVFVNQHSEQKKYTKNQENLITMAANIIESAVTRRITFIQLQNALEDAKAAEKAKTTFLTTMSHEIRTPLNAVLGFTELLQAKDIDDKTRTEYIKDIEVAGKTLLGLINDILDLSKLSVGKMVFIHEETFLRDVISQTITMFLPKCREKQIDFKAEIPDDFPIIWIDTPRMRQIFFNLIGNAVKFTDSGSITIRVDFSRKTKEIGDLFIHIIDTGSGISENDITHLFDPFYQAARPRSREHRINGTGLGLPICKRMLEEMGGALSVESKVDKGSKFTASLYDVKYKDLGKPGQKNKASATNTMILQQTVLVVDDATMNLDMFRALFKELGISIDTSNNAADAWLRLQIKHYDYVFTDLRMPNMKGIVFAEKIHNEYKGKMPSIVGVVSDSEENIHFDTHLFDAILSKPVTAGMLRDFFKKQQNPK